MGATEARPGVPLTDEALRRRISYNQLLRLVLLGKVRGWKEGSRWMVESSEQARRTHKTGDAA